MKRRPVRSKGGGRKWTVGQSPRAAPLVGLQAELTAERQSEPSAREDIELRADSCCESRPTCKSCLAGGVALGDASVDLLRRSDRATESAALAYARSIPAPGTEAGRALASVLDADSSTLCAQRAKPPATKLRSFLRLCARSAELVADAGDLAERGERDRRVQIVVERGVACSAARSAASR